MENKSIMTNKKKKIFGNAERNKEGNTYYQSTDPVLIQGTESAHLNTVAEVIRDRAYENVTEVVPMQEAVIGEGCEAIKSAKMTWSAEKKAKKRLNEHAQEVALARAAYTRARSRAQEEVGKAPSYQTMLRMDQESRMTEYAKMEEMFKIQEMAEKSELLLIDNEKLQDCDVAKEYETKMPFLRSLVDFKEKYAFMRVDGYKIDNLSRIGLNMAARDAEYTMRILEGRMQQVSNVFNSILTDEQKKDLDDELKSNDFEFREDSKWNQQVERNAELLRYVSSRILVLKAEAEKEKEENARAKKSDEERKEEERKEEEAVRAELKKIQQENALKKEDASKEEKQEEKEKQAGDQTDGASLEEAEIDQNTWAESAEKSFEESEEYERELEKIWLRREEEKERRKEVIRKLSKKENRLKANERDLLLYYEEIFNNVKETDVWGNTEEEIYNELYHMVKRETPTSPLYDLFFKLDWNFTSIRKRHRDDVEKIHKKELQNRRKEEEKKWMKLEEEKKERQKKDEEWEAEWREQKENVTKRKAEAESKIEKLNTEWDQLGESNPDWEQEADENEKYRKRVQYLILLGKNQEEEDEEDYEEKEENQNIYEEYDWYREYDESIYGKEIVTELKKKMKSFKGETKEAIAYSKEDGQLARRIYNFCYDEVDSIMEKFNAWRKHSGSLEKKQDNWLEIMKWYSNHIQYIYVIQVLFDAGMMADIAKLADLGNNDEYDAVGSNLDDLESWAEKLQEITDTIESELLGEQQKALENAKEEKVKLLEEEERLNSEDQKHQEEKKKEMNRITWEQEKMKNDWAMEERNMKVTWKREWVSWVEDRSYVH